ncbi:MAG: DcrB-related protein [Peptostreptococcus sp.]|nr:DcrB-related protein [Peptostreptococcus sp.]MDU5682147.1 DcrB-related protein [Peptostreptococcus sp.]
MLLQPYFNNASNKVYYFRHAGGTHFLQGSTMKYTLPEGSFTLFPAAWQDATMNILRDEESGLALVVSRGPIPDGSDFEQEFHRQWEMLRPQMGEIEQGDFMRVSAGPERTIRAVEVETVFTRNGQSQWQKQLALQAPDRPVLLIFTLSAQRAFSEQDAQRWERIKQTLTLDDNRNV